MSAMTKTLFVGPTHIALDERGVAWIDGTGHKVVQVARDLRGGMTPEEIHEQFPDLSLAQIHAALCYYYDHQATLDAAMEEADRSAERMRAQAENGVSRRELEERWDRLHAEGKLPPRSRSDS